MAYKVKISGAANDQQSAIITITTTTTDFLSSWCLTVH
jgi:hypothetical protein